MDQKIAEMDEKMATKDDLKKYPTKDELTEAFEKNKKEILYETTIIVNNAVSTSGEKLLKEIKPLQKAQDKDSVKIIELDRRVTMLERSR